MSTKSAAMASAVHLAKITDLQSVLERGRAALQLLPGSLYSAVSARLEYEFLAASERLQLLRDLDPAESQTWEKMVAASIAVAELGEECLELAQGALARTRGIDEDACAAADRLLIEITKSLPLPAWDSFCVPGEGDGYSHRTKVIRLGVGTGIGSEAVWSLHVVVHELGHQVAGLITREAGTRTLHDVNEVLRKAGATSPMLGNQVAELFADCFAAWTLGPAYGLATAWRGFGPGPADDPHSTDTHPAPADRIAEIVATVRDLDDADALADKIVEVWDHGATPQARRPEGHEPGEDLSRFGGDLRRILRDRLRGSRFAGRDRALGVAALLVDRSPLPRGDPRGAGHSITDVLNGAWWARAHHLADSTRISARAWSLIA
jgi:hypothetical protein